MFVNLVKKHGLVPKSAMPESQSSSETMRMNAMLSHRLRAGAKELRELRGAGAPVEACRETKREILEAIHRILCIHLGTPPRTFDWQWNDDDGAFHRDGQMTPQAFAETYVQLPIDDYVCLVHDPRPSSPIGKTFTVQYLGNVVGGEIVTYLNVEIGLMKRLAMEAIADRTEPVWFGCDVAKMMRRDLGVWDRELFDYEGLYDTTFDLDKADRLSYHHSMMTHAMLFTGVDIADGRSRRWRVENSWGEENGKKGFYAMNDSWFDEYVLEIAAPKSALPMDLQEALDLEPIVLPPWDPMGALARVSG
jgi:bleomycin hydrolase